MTQGTSSLSLAVPQPRKGWSFAAIHDKELGTSVPEADPNMTADPYEQDEFLLQRTARGYAAASSIHGIEYIAEKARPVPEK